MLNRLLTFPAMRMTFAALAARGGARAIYNHAGFVDVGVLMVCGMGNRDAYDRITEPPAAIVPAIGVGSARSLGMPMSRTTFADGMVP